jgi:hypothetical protein
VAARPPRISESLKRCRVAISDTRARLPFCPTNKKLSKSYHRANRVCQAKMREYSLR